MSTISNYVFVCTAIYRIYAHYDNPPVPPLEILLFLPKDESDSLELMSYVSININVVMANFTINTHTFTTRNDDFPINALLATCKLKI